MHILEQTGEKFDLKTYFNSRKLCMDVVQNIASKVNPGIKEIDGQHLIREEFKTVGVTKFWHPSKFRIGPETTKSFRESPDPEIQMKDHDLFFIDVGPIIEDHEADYGETFFLSSQTNSPLHDLKANSQKIWNEVAMEWKRSKLSGIELFHFANQRAQKLGYQLNPLMAGHRLGDFPHALFSKEKLFSLNFPPSENLWVLEIHILNPDLKRGAFFEDILI